jgi:phage gp29-like protein
MDFTVKDKGGEPDEELANLFKTSWFNNWLSIAIESIFWGVSAIQYGPVIDDRFSKIKSIPKYNIRPKQEGLVYSQNDEKADVLFNQEPFKTWTSFVYPRMFGDQYQLGKYNKIAKWFILKREVTQFWAIFNELFGHPFRVTKTEIKDNIRRANAISAMEAMTTASYGVIDLEDEIEFVTASGTGSGYKTFSDFIEVADKQMSKAVLGSTMVLDEGSSRSQGEVHQKNTNAFIVGYASIIQNFINDELVPKMAKLGFPISADAKFHYEHIEKLTKVQWSEIISKLSTSFDIKPETITELIGIEVEEKVIDLPTTTNADDIENKSGLIDTLKNFYKRS